MKKLLLISTIALTFTACNKCQDCTCEGNADVGEVCQDDFDSNSDYNAAIIALEAIPGCNCN